MPQGYERSRSKFSRDYADDNNGYVRPGGGGGRNRFMWIAGIAVVAVVAVVAVIIIANLPGSAPTGGQPTDQTQATDSPAPTDTSDAQATDASGDTSQPDDTASLSPTDTPPSDATASPDDTSTASPTETPEATESSSPDNTGSTDALDAPDVEGKPKNVQDYLPLRSSASSTADKLVEIHKDETFTVLAVSTTKTWLKVKYDDKTGYVLAKYVAIGSDGNSKVCTVTSTTVNVRSGAGKSKNIIGTLKQGDTVVVLSETTASDGTWLKVKVGSKTGYVFKQYCREDSVS